jgi:hypothetical protein
MRENFQGKHYKRTKVESPGNLGYNKFLRQLGDRQEEA